MTRGEWLGAALLVAVCVLVGGFLWARDNVQIARAVVPPPTPVVFALRAGTVLTTQPGLDARTLIDRAAVTCRPKETRTVKIKRAAKLNTGELYLDVWVRDRCQGWTPADQVVRYPQWLDALKAGDLIHYTD